MRRTHAFMLAAPLIFAMALPAAAPARPLTILGSLVITGAGSAALPNNAITGFAVIANPGLEKTMVQQLPPYTLPIFIDGEAEDESTRSRPDDRPHGDDGPPGLRPDGPPTVRPDGPGRPDDRPRIRLLRRNLDTTVVLTNTTDDLTLTIVVTIWDAAGTTMLAGPRSMTFDPHQTQTFQVSDLLPLLP